MKFIHEDPEFQALLSIVATEVGVGAGLVEKDYWVTHTLWSLQQSGLALWFKGGTSLSKGFGRLRRFSGDLDLKIEPGDCPGLPPAPDWSRAGKRHDEAREAFFRALANGIRVPDCSVEREVREDRQLVLKVLYPGRLIGHLPPVTSPFVRLEIGSARVTPSVPRDLDSWVHARVVAARRLDEFFDNRPRRLSCLHPTVTLLEKLEAISRSFSRGLDPARYVRHYGDASVIVSHEATLPELEGGVQRLGRELLAAGDLKRRLVEDDPAFAPIRDGNWKRIGEAYAATASLHWGARQPLEDCCEHIRSWLRRNPVVPAAGG